MRKLSEINWGQSLLFHKDKLESVLQLYNKSIEIKCALESVSDVSSVSNNDGGPLIQNLISSPNSLSMIRDSGESKVECSDLNSNSRPKESPNIQKTSSISNQQNEKDNFLINTGHSKEIEKLQTLVDNSVLHSNKTDNEIQNRDYSNINSTIISCQFCNFQHQVEFDMRIHYEEKHRRQLQRLREEWNCYDNQAITYKQSNRNW